MERVKEKKIRRKRKGLSVWEARKKKKKGCRTGEEALINRSASSLRFPRDTYHVAVAQDYIQVQKL